MTFNTEKDGLMQVLDGTGGFKPCYKWITFNTNRRRI